MTVKELSSSIKKMAKIANQKLKDIFATWTPPRPSARQPTRL